MEIKGLEKKPEIEKNHKLISAYSQFETLLTELRKKSLPDDMVSSINRGIDRINAISVSEKELRKQIKITQSSILKLLEKSLKLVTKNHYRNTWLALGMVLFGIPLGMAFGIIMDNIGLLGIGLPVGMVIGLVVGTGMDKKAIEEGRQLDIEIKP